MTIDSQLSTTEPKRKKSKNKLSQQLEQEQNHRNGDHMEDLPMGRGMGENRSKGTGSKKHNW